MRQRLLSDVLTQRPIGLELALVKELVCRGLVGEGGVGAAVLLNDLLFVACERGLQVEQVAGLAVVRVPDLADREVVPARAILAQMDLPRVDLCFSGSVIFRSM